MRSEHPKTHRRLALALLTLSLVAPTLSQDTEAPPTLAERLAKWKLEAAVGLPGPEQLKALEKIIEDAKAIASGDGDEDVKDAAATLAASATSTLLARTIDARTEELGEIAASVSLLEGRTNDLQLRTEVEAALERGDQQLLQKLGDYAIPALRDLALRTNGIPVKEGSITALGWLTRYHPGAALPVIVQLIQSKNELVREEAYRNGANAFAGVSPAVWNREGDAGWSLVNPKWSTIPLQALEEPNLKDETIGRLLGAFADKGHLPKEGGEVATRLANDGHLSVKAWVVPPDGLWFYKQLLEHGDEDARVNVIERLHLSPFGSLAVEAALVGSNEEQLEVAENLLSSWVFRWKDESRTDIYSEPHLPAPSEELTRAFKKFALSNSTNVVTAAMEDAEERFEKSGSLPFGGDTLKELVAEAPTFDHKRRFLSLTRGIPQAERLPTLATILREIVAAGDESERFKNAIQPFYNLSYYGLPGGDAFWSLAEDLGSCLEPQSLDNYWSWVNLVHRRVENGTLEAPPMLKWIEGYAGTEPWPEPVRAAITHQNQAWIQSLSAEYRLRFLIEIAPRILDANGEGVAKLIRDGYLNEPESLEAAVLDPRSTDAMIANAGQYLMRTIKKPLKQELISPFAEAYYRYQPHHDKNAIVLPWMNAEQKEEVLSIWLKDENVPDSFPLQLSPQLPDERFARLMPAILKRFPRAEWTKLNEPRVDLLARAATFAVGQSEIELHPLLRGDLREASRVYADISWAISRKRFPSLQPIAIRILGADQTRGYGWGQAVDAVGGYFNEASANALLEAVQAALTAHQRQEAMEALREITEWRETARVWSVASDAQVQRAEAIEELVTLIEDPAQSIEARAASIRGLGLLAAAEELPLIVRSLSSTTPEIQEAARAALARLEQEADK